YKVAQVVPIQISGYNKTCDTLNVFFNNGSKIYTYDGVSPFLYDKIKSLLKYKNYAKVNEILRNLSA
ncbi:MAG TPA: hypothetical protein VMZ91_02830, partial [Candidatus Paceibacterota bacterium]|nr:hypothetical protein [Candidatus Paceibacterota bacterium]